MASLTIAFITQWTLRAFGDLHSHRVASCPADQLAATSLWFFVPTVPGSVAKMHYAPVAAAGPLIHGATAGDDV
jgi:hypothetical protein